jgi:hypothetical protein
MILIAWFLSPILLEAIDKPLTAEAIVLFVILEVYQPNDIHLIWL